MSLDIISRIMTNDISPTLMGVYVHKRKDQALIIFAWDMSSLLPASCLPAHARGDMLLNYIRLGYGSGRGYTCLSVKYGHLAVDILGAWDMSPNIAQGYVAWLLAGSAGGICHLTNNVDNVWITCWRCR